MPVAVSCTFFCSFVCNKFLGICGSRNVNGKILSLIQGYMSFVKGLTTHILADDVRTMNSSNVCQFLARVHYVSTLGKRFDCNANTES